MDEYGGICGATYGLTLYSCYNMGDISGPTDASVLNLACFTGGVRYGAGGLVGVGMSNLLTFGEDKLELIMKIPIFGEVTIPLTKISHRAHAVKVSNCYSAGKVEGGIRYDGWIINYYQHNGAIIGCDFNLNINTKNGNWKTPEYTNNYYLSGTSQGGVDSTDASNYKGLSNEALIDKLYNWATKASGAGGLFVPPGETDAGKYIYNTIAPVEKHLGYYGYGVLWWQLEGYGKATFHIHDDVGRPINIPTLKINSTDPVVLNRDAYKSYNCPRWGNTYGYVMMLREGDYSATASAEGYVQETGIPTTFSIIKNAQREVDVYVGKRPEFIFARFSGSGNIEEVPEGNYYVIAVGGGRLWS